MNLFDDAKTVRQLTSDYYAMIREAVKIAIINGFEKYGTEEGDKSPSIETMIADERCLEAIDEYLYSECDCVVTYTRDAETILFVSRNDDAINDIYDDDSALAVATVESKASAAFLADCRELLSNEYFLSELEAELKNR